MGIINKDEKYKLHRRDIFNRWERRKDKCGQSVKYHAHVTRKSLLKEDQPLPEKTGCAKGAPRKRSCKHIMLYNLAVGYKEANLKLCLSHLAKGGESSSLGGDRMKSLRTRDGNKNSNTLILI